MADLVLDVVCGMRVDPVIAPFEAVHGDKMYYFCSDRCFREFQRDPETYLDPEFAGEYGADTKGEECLINEPTEGCS